MKIDPAILAEAFKFFDKYPVPLRRVVRAVHGPDGNTSLMDSDGISVMALPTEDYEAIRRWEVLGQARENSLLGSVSDFHD